MASGYAMYLSQQGLEHIASHKYKSAGYSWFDNVLNPFWEYCVGFLPMVRRCPQNLPVPFQHVRLTS